MSDYYSTCDDAVTAYVERIRALARGGPVSWRMVLFAPDTAGCRPIEIDPSDTNDLDAEITWAANRMARIIGATAAAFVNEIPTQGAVVCVERRGASELECFVIGRGEAPPRRQTSREAFWLLPGGDPNDGWGWQDHDSLDLDRNQQSLRPARDTEEGGG